MPSIDLVVLALVVPLVPIHGFFAVPFAAIATINVLVLILLRGAVNEPPPRLETATTHDHAFGVYP